MELRTFVSDMSDKLVEDITSTIAFLDSFFNSNTHLFTLMGVFGALSVYLKQIDVAESAIFLSMLLASMFAVLILIKFFLELQTTEGWIKSSSLGAFILVFVMLNFFLLDYIISFSGIWGSVIRLSIIYGSFLSYFAILKGIGTFSELVASEGETRNERVADALFLIIIFGPIIHFIINSVGDSHINASTDAIAISAIPIAVYEAISNLWAGISAIILIVLILVAGYQALKSGFLFLITFGRNRLENSESG